MANRNVHYDGCQRILVVGVSSASGGPEGINEARKTLKFRPADLVGLGGQNHWHSPGR
ncbi:MAG: hypothetical protein OXG16_12140 [Rhodospirillales bacterium]|nr:hypothetical protein [Rhodospirillales bacterium]MDE0712989.1 hypothetical protein [Rhodospirillales bacterium]